MHSTSKRVEEFRTSRVQELDAAAGAKAQRRAQLEEEYKLRMRSEEACAQELERLAVPTRVLDFMQEQLSSDMQDEVLTSTWSKKLKMLVDDTGTRATHMLCVEEARNSALLGHVGRTRLAKSCGSHNDSLSWNLSRVKQDGAIRADDMDHKAQGSKTSSTPHPRECKMRRMSPRGELKTARSMK